MSIHPFVHSFRLFL